MALSGRSPESSAAKKEARTAARNKRQVHPEPQAAEVKQSFPLKYAKHAGEQADIKSFDAALDEKDPQPGFLSRVFDHIALAPVIAEPVLKLCQTFENEAGYFRDHKSGDYREELKKYAGKSVFNDDGGFQVWVLATILAGVDKEEKLSAAIKQSIFDQVKAIIFNKQEDICEEIIELYGQRPGKRGNTRVREAITKYGKEFVAHCFMTGLASVFCGKICEELGKHKDSAMHNMAGIFVDLIQHQVTTNSTFMVLYADLKDQFANHAKLDESDEFNKFIEAIEKDCLKRLPFVDSGKYIPLLKLAKNIMQLSVKSLTYDFAITELLAMVKQFEMIGKDRSDNSIEKYHNFNEDQISQLSVRINAMLGTTDQEAKEVSLANAQVILGYHLDKITCSESNLQQTNPELFKCVNDTIKSFLAHGKIAHERKFVTEKLDWLRDIRLILEQPFSIELQREMMTYLQGPLDKNLDAIIKNILDNKYKNPDDYLPLFSLFNAITKQNEPFADRSQSHAIVCDLAYKYLHGRCALPNFINRCTELHKFYVRLTSSASDHEEEKYHADEEKASPSSCSYNSMFQLYAKIVEYADSEILKDVVEQVKKIAVKPDRSFIQSMESISSALNYLSLVEKHSDKDGVMSQAAWKCYEQAAIQIASINKASEFGCAANYLARALLMYLMKHFKDQAFVNQLLSLDPSKVDIFHYCTRYEKLRALKQNIDRDKQNVLSVAAEAVYQDARAEFANDLAGNRSPAANNLHAILKTVSDIMGPDRKRQDVSILINQLAEIPAPVLSSKRKILSSLFIFAGIATLVIGFALSPFTAFTSAYLGFQAAVACMAAGAVVAGVTGISLYHAKQPSGIVKSLGGFISAVNHSELKFAAAPALVTDAESPRQHRS